MARVPEKLVFPVAIAFGAAILTGLLAALGALERPEHFFYDERLKGTPATEIEDSILPIAVDDDSTERVGRWPWPRWETAELARGLGRAGARVVLLDLSYRDRTNPEEDGRFVEVMRDAPAAIAAYTALPARPANDDPTPERRAAVEAFERRYPVDLPGAARAFPEAEDAARLFLPIADLVRDGPGLGLSSLDLRADDDGVVRRMPMLFRYVNAAGETRWLPSLTLATACRYFGVDPVRLEVAPGEIVLPDAAAPGNAPGRVVIPVDRAARMLVHYATPGALASRWQSAWAIRARLADGDARALGNVRDSIALVYLTYAGSGDFHPTPVSKNVPGGIVNLDVLNTILTGKFVRVAPAWVDLLVILLAGALLVASARRWTSYRLGLAWVGVVFAIVTADFILWRAASIMADVAIPTTFAAIGGLGIVVWRTWLEDRERIDLLFTLRALQNQAMRERKAGTSGGTFGSATDALKRNVDYGRFIESLRDIDQLQNTYIGKHYKLKGLIDEGGMGLVFRAWDEALGREVAIKVLTRYSSKLLKRFQNEAKAIGQLDHPNVVQVFAVAAEGDIPYIVMEFVPGRSLSQRIRDDGPLPPAAAAEVIAQVARGLDAAHVRQIIHRDIKTSNILLTKDGTAKIIDFGIAKLFDEDGEALTGEKEVVGTADYMSPEQGAGRGVDHRSDIYSLGITLYRVLTGKLPFKADDTVAVLLKQMREPLPDVRKSRPDTPDELVRIMTKMVEKNPADRYQSCREVVNDLEAFLRNVRASSPEPRKRVSP